jgi:hypothetical protein
MRPYTAERQAVASDRLAPVEGRARPTMGGAHARDVSQTRIVLQIFLGVAGIALGLWVLHRLSSVVLVLILAALFAYVIAPLVELARRPIRLAGRRRRLSRGPPSPSSMCSWLAACRERRRSCCPARRSR